MLIKVKVFAGSKKIGIIKKSESSFDVKVKEKAERGLANKAVVSALATYFKIPTSKIRLARGAKQRNKIFEIFPGGV